MYCSWTTSLKEICCYNSLNNVFCFNLKTLDISLITHLTHEAEEWNTKWCATPTTNLADGLLLSLNWCGRDVFNAPSSSSSMNCTYPPTNKPPKQRKPIKRNKRTQSPLFFLHLSSPSLRLGRCCHHCGWETLHLSVSYV